MDIHSNEILPMFRDAGFPDPPHMVYWNMSGGNDVWSVHNPSTSASETSGSSYTLLAGGSSTILRFLIHLQKAEDWKQLTSFDLLKFLCNLMPGTHDSPVDTSS